MLFSEKAIEDRTHVSSDMNFSAEAINNEVCALKQMECNQYSVNAYPENFELFWNAYPRKQGKSKAYTAYNNIKPPRPTLTQILSSIETHQKTDQWKTMRFIPLPTTFLNQRRWEDEFTPEDFEPKNGKQYPFQNNQSVIEYYDFKFEEDENHDRA